ncbi:MAG: PIF1 family DEAD/DEAH box helicase [Candidatus Sungiibacteriota bacterium]
MTQQEALDILKTGANVFLTGEPGSGKSHTVNAYVAYLRSCGVEPAITASTGIAATHIGGMTIHSWSGIGIADHLSEEEAMMIAGRTKIRKRLSNARVLIIDEVSMLSAAALSMVDSVCRQGREIDMPFGGLQVVLVGDFFQLPPIGRAGAKARFAYTSDAWRVLNPVVCYLGEQYRQDDPQYLEVLSAIRANRFGAHHRERIFERRHTLGSAPEDVPKLFSHNADVDRINEARLKKLPGETAVFAMEAFGPAALIEVLKRNCLSPESLALKKDAAVMCTKNNPAAGFVNGTLGRVMSFDRESGYPIVETRGGAEILVKTMEWVMEEEGRTRARVAQIPLRLAWAMTVHKSQGMSMDAAVVDLSDAFEYGQGYVALSRVRRLSGLYLLGANARAFMVSDEVLEKDQRFRLVSGKAEEKLAGMDKEELGIKHRAFIMRCGGRMPDTSADFQEASSLRGQINRSDLAQIRAKYPNAYRPWSDADDATLRDAFEHKPTTAQLAKHFGRQPGAIRGRLVKLGLIVYNKDSGRYESQAHGS